MKKLFLFCMMTLFASCMIFGQAKQTTGQSAVAEITALENTWNDASQKYDVSWFERNIADSYHGTDEDGVVDNKSTMIANVKNRVAKPESMSLEKFSVQVYGDTAIATAVFVFKGTFKGKDVSGKYPYTDVWVRIGGRWQCVANHNSKLPSK